MSGDSWKITLPCTRLEAEALTESAPDIGGFDTPPVLMTSEPDPSRPDDWQLDIYLDAAPDEALIAELVALVPSATRADARVEHVPAQDWVTVSQRDLKPITAGRYHIHTAAHADSVPSAKIAIRIEAGQAFGTGQHETTTGCLHALDELPGRFANIADVGTGSGILALAAIKRWREARVTASDIDPVSIDVTRENIEQNGERAGDSPGAIDLVVAPGLDHARLQARAPYDLILANILAGPLIELAPALTDALAPGGTIVLAGLLADQRGSVLSAYEARGCRLQAERRIGDWPTLILKGAA